MISYKRFAQIRTDTAFYSRAEILCESRDYLTVKYTGKSDSDPFEIVWKTDRIPWVIVVSIKYFVD